MGEDQGIVVTTLSNPLNLNCFEMNHICITSALVHCITTPCHTLVTHWFEASALKEGTWHPLPLYFPLYFFILSSIYVSQTDNHCIGIPESITRDKEHPPPP